VRKFFKKILCPIDFDDNSIAALHYARDLAVENGATIYLMHVVFEPLARPEFPLDQYPLVSEEPSKVALQKVVQKELHGKVRYETATRIGKPADAINEAAEDFDVDLIVMATSGRKGLAHFLLGSIAEHVVRSAKRPVLTIRPQIAAD
jgi:universal stress protein A